jgi:ABC-type uncharacterized transport system fused permease/ATPase subunit
LGVYIAIINAYFPRKSKVDPKIRYGIIKKMAESKKKLYAEVAKQMVTLSTSAFGLVAALAWNSVIQEFINVYIKKWMPEGSGIISLLIYALVVTVLAVLVTLQLSKLSERLNN